MSIINGKNFAWVKESLPIVPSRGNTCKALKYSLNQKTYLRVFLDNGDVPMVFRNYSRTHMYAYRLGITVKVGINIILGTSTCYALIFKSFFINLSTFSFFNAIKTIK